MEAKSSDFFFGIILPHHFARMLEGGCLARGLSSFCAIFLIS
jgi:ABC-type sulfate transport system permease component